MLFSSSESHELDHGATTEYPQSEREGRIVTVALTSIITEYMGIFQGDGHLESKLNLETNPHLQPVRLVKSRVPLALGELLKRKLASLQ